MALLRTLRPMRWRHAFAPLLPIALAAATLEKPEPFIVGIKADFVVPKAALENAVVVDLDANDVRGAGDAARGQQGSTGVDGFPRAFAEPLLADLRRLASREPPVAADVETSLDENETENETDRTLPEWARNAAHAAAARAAARGQRWSAHHDDAVGESFKTFWRRCFRGYRAFLRAEPFLPAGGKSPSEKSVRSDAGVFDAAGFYRAQVASKDRGTREAAAFVRWWRRRRRSRRTPGRRSAPRSNARRRKNGEVEPSSEASPTTPRTEAARPTRDHRGRPPRPTSTRRSSAVEPTIARCSTRSSTRTATSASRWDPPGRGTSGKFAAAVFRDVRRRRRRGRATSARARSCTRGVDVLCPRARTRGTPRASSR